MTEKKTSAHTDDWVDGAFRITGAIPAHITANKCDLHDGFRIGTNEVAWTSEAYDTCRLFTSGRRGDNANAVFHDVAQRVPEGQPKSLAPSSRKRG